MLKFKMKTPENCLHRNGSDKTWPYKTILLLKPVQYQTHSVTDKFKVITFCKYNHNTWKHHSSCRKGSGSACPSQCTGYSVCVGNIKPHSKSMRFFLGMVTWGFTVAAFFWTTFLVSLDTTFPWLDFVPLLGVSADEVPKNRESK